jgi:predicted RNA-binding protein Jag
VYDGSNDLHEFFGANRAEAIAKACDFFRVSEEGLAIYELDPKEIYGLAARTVIVGAPRDRKPPTRDRSSGGADEGRGGRRGRDSGPSRDRGGRGNAREGRGDRGDRGDRERGGPRAEGRGGRRGESREAREPREVRAEPLRERVVSSEPSVGTAVGEIGEIGRFVLGAVERMGFGPFEVSEATEEGVVIVSLKGIGAKALGGGEGRAVDALQLLANQAAMRSSDDAPRIVLDVEGDLEEREGHLADLAERAARRARETGRAIALDPMSPRDRRAIHLALRDAQGIATMSVGESRYRQVVVVPEGAAEYEEALRESRAVSAADE